MDPTKILKIYIFIDFWNLTIDIISILFETSLKKLEWFLLFCILNYNKLNLIFVKFLKI